MLAHAKNINIILFYLPSMPRRRRRWND